jgi:flagellar biosynthesis GTPase FlhF
MDNQTAERLRALWKSGRDKYTSFFSVLGEVRTEIGDEALAHWCLEELHVGITEIKTMAAVLSKSDAQRAKAELAAASKAENERRAAAAAAEKKARDEETRRRELEKAEHDKKLSEIKAETARNEITGKKVKDTEEARQKRRSNPKDSGKAATAKRQGRRLRSNVSDADLDELVNRFVVATERCNKGLLDWNEGTIAKAIILCAARDRFTADQDFGSWIANSHVTLSSLSHQDRAALLGLGRFGEKKLRGILENTTSHSARQIWQDNKPILKAVEN